MTNRKLNQNSTNLIHASEGCRLKAYPDPASSMGKEMRKSENQRVKDWQNMPGDPWTVGWGSTGLDYFNLDVQGKPTRISPNTTWTQEQCDSRSADDISHFGKDVSDLLKVQVNDNQFGALVCFAYNVGTNNLRNSTLLKLVNEGKFQPAADEFLKWTKAQGVVLPGLVKRREAERRLFLSPSV